MSVVVKEKMSADEFLAWAERQQGRWELHEGALVAMAPERAVHLQTKGEAFAALKAAIARAGVPCRVLPDGATVRISQKTVFEPDATVYRGPRMPPDALEVPDPIIVVEVLSPSTASFDQGQKLIGYFSLPSLIHYLILDPDRRMLVHHKRGQGDLIETRILADGLVRLDPPGLDVPVATVFGEQ